MKPTPLVFLELNNRFATLERSLASLTECVNILAKRTNIVISESLGVATGGETVAGVVVFDSTVFTFGLESSYLGAGVVIVMNSSLVRHVCKISEVPDQLLSIKLLFKNKLSVSILGLYAGASLMAWFSQAGDINSLIAKAVNESSFVILGGDFNKNNTRKCASFKKCFDLGLVDSLKGSLFAKMSTWTNSHGVTKALDYILIFSSLVNTIIDGSVASIEDYFNTDYKAVSTSVSLGDEVKWSEFKNATAANTVMFLDKFELARRAFKKKWFKDYNGVFTKKSFKLHNLEILVSKIVKASCEMDFGWFESLLRHWVFLDSLVSFGVSLDHVYSALYGVRRSYCVSKLAESLQAEESNIRSAIERRMENFVVNKGHTIHSVLECSFCKVVLDHLVSDGNLILDPVEVKNKVDDIIEN
ncbi:hypothetical protein G9A89_019221 [Geosiphon pyriformis]|nr:hypothetical protein G9A89_019221 [Geosiphon pyriformis]